MAAQIRRVGAVAPVHHVEVDDGDRTRVAREWNLRRLPWLVQGLQPCHGLRVLRVEPLPSFPPKLPSPQAERALADLGLDLRAKAVVELVQPVAGRLQRPPGHVLAARHDSRRAFRKGGVLRVVEQHREAGPVDPPQAVHGVVGMVVAVLVQGLRFVEQAEVVVAMEVQVVVRSENGGQRAAHHGLVEQPREFRNARQQVVVAERTPLVQAIEGVVHAVVELPRKLRLQDDVSLAHESAHGVVVEQTGRGAR